MEGSMRKTTALLFAVTTFMAMLVMGATAADYTVGGSQGWNLGVSYATWISGKTFKVGDTLEFKYAPSAHNLLEVSKSSYDSCSIANPMKTYTSGSDKITLSSAGPKYFICGVPGHCSGGMKVSMNIMASSPSSNSSKSPSPSPAPSKSPPTSPSPVKSPPKSPSPSPSVPPMASAPAPATPSSPVKSPPKSPSMPPMASAPAPATPSSSSAAAPGPSGMTTTPSSASAPGGVGASPPNSDNNAASSLSPAILSFLGAVVLCVF